MKKSFSTLACPEWDFKQIMDAAMKFGYDGIEIRGIQNETFAPDIPVFSSENRKKTMKALRENHLDIPVFSSDCTLCDKQNIDKTMDEAVQYIDLAHDCHVDFVRILGDYQPMPCDIDGKFVADQLQKLGEYAADQNVTLLLETNGYFANSDNIMDVLGRTQDLPVAILWDVHHTYRYFDESPKQTYDLLGPYIQHIHIKDSVVKEDQIQYRLLGEGDVPVQQAIDILKENHFGGFLSLEWVRRWDLSLEESGIVLPHFIRYVTG